MKLNSLQVEQLYLQQEEPRKHLEQKKSQLETARAMLFRLTGSIAVSDTFFAIARTYDVEIVDVSSAGQASGRIEGVSCSLLPFTVKVEGDIHNLINFIIKWNNSFSTGVVKWLEISTPAMSSMDGSRRSLANIQLVIYNLSE